MIYTSYFGNLKHIPENIIRVSICAKAPNWYNGLQYKKLAPKYDFFMKWKETHDNNYYIEHFNSEVLDKLNANDVIEELVGVLDIDEDIDICLLCYEKPSDFCHRHLVADWLNKNGFKCVEFQNKK